MKALMSAETWFTAEEAVEIGLADRVSESTPRAQASWDLSAYANAPKPKEPEQVDAITTEHRERQHQRMKMLNRITHQ